MKKSILFAAVFLLAAQIPLFSQISLFSAANKNRASRGDTPTTINADAMDIDIANNKATFLGNVLVDDPEMLITCRKMVPLKTPKRMPKIRKQPKIRRKKRKAKIPPEEKRCRGSNVSTMLSSPAKRSSRTGKNRKPLPGKRSMMSKATP